MSVLQIITCRVSNTDDQTLHITDNFERSDDIQHQESAGVDPEEDAVLARVVFLSLLALPPLCPEQS